jgi:PAS domain S-box-containing protein
MASVTYISRRQTRAVWPQSESNELLRPAIEVGGFGIFENDLKRKRTRFSPELCAILGLPVGTELPYEEAWGLVDERERAAFEAAANADASSPEKGKWSVVCRVLRADNAVRWILVHGRRIYRRTANGIQPVRSMGVVLDVTHLKETEEALRQSEARLRIAASGAALGIFEWNPATDQAVWQNDRMYEIFGHTREGGTLSQQQFVERYLHPDHYTAFGG